MDEPFLAMICLCAFNFAPSGWEICQGTIFSIAQNSAVFALVGTYYGGNGMSTFGIPDLRGRTPIGFGQGPGLSNYYQGETGGTETITLTSSQMPMHTHTITNTLSVAQKASTQAGTSSAPGATVVPAVLPTIGAGVNTFPVNGYGTTADTTLLPTPVSGGITAAVAGGNLPFSVMQPYLALNYCFSMQGIFPSRG